MKPVFELCAWILLCASNEHHALNTNDAILKLANKSAIFFVFFFSYWCTVSTGSYIYWKYDDLQTCVVGYGFGDFDNAKHDNLNFDQTKYR